MLRPMSGVAGDIPKACAWPYGSTSARSVPRLPGGSGFLWVPPPTVEAGVVKRMPFEKPPPF